MAFGEVSGTRQRAGSRQEQLDPLLGRGVVGDEPKRALEPPCGARGRTVGGGLACLTEGRDRDGIAVSGRQLHMVGSGRCRSAASCQRVGAPLVRTQPPAAERRLVDRPPDERVPEAKAPGDLRSDGRGRFAAARRAPSMAAGSTRGGGGRRQLRIERITGDGRAFEHEAGVVGQQPELLGQRGGHAPGYLDPAE